MDSVNVLTTCNGNTFGLLLPAGCKYMELVELITAELGIQMRGSVVDIEYDVGGNMMPVRIANDSSLLFYMDMKRKEPQITSYVLHVKVEKMTDHKSCGLRHMNNDIQNSAVLLGTEPSETGIILGISTSNVPTMQEFASNMQIDIVDPSDDEYDINNVVLTGEGMESIAENQIFRDKKLLKRTAAFYAIKNNFQYMVYKSDRREYVLKCIVDSCKWKLRASRMGKTELFKVRYIRHEHSCSMDVVVRDHRQANSALIGDCIKHKYTSAKTIYTPIDIMHDMASTYGLTLKYGKAWRAREHALEEVMGDPDHAYNKLAVYFKELEKKNPGSKTDIEVDGDGHFRYGFMALGASIQGWKHCKPVVIVDATFLTGRYGGCLFTACTQDANNSIFILAFGVGDSENNDSWNWFLRRFKEAYGERENMCIVSDRHGSIEHATREIYPGVMHGFCAHHILQNLKTSYGNSGKDIATPFNAAARCYTIEEFNHNMDQLDQINEGIRKDLVKIGFHKCSRVHTPTNRFTTMTSNVVESVNSVTKSVKHCPVDYLFESLRHTIQTWFSRNRSIAKGTFTRLTPKLEKLLRSNAKSSLKLKVSASNDFLYQVSNENTQHVVDLMELKCTCNRFQLDGVPCQHALAVIGDKAEQPYKYCSAYHTKESYVDTYGGIVIPLGDTSQWGLDNDRGKFHIFPPKSKRQPGRPKRTRRRTRLECIHPMTCGRCGGKGHNRRTCNQPLPQILIGKRKR